MKTSSTTFSKGFTLVEMAIVITVVGLLLSFITVSWMSMKNSQQISQTKTKLEIAASCLEDYVIHSQTIPPQAYFTQHCAAKDPWGSNFSYYNIVDNQNISAVITKTVRDANGDHPDAAFLVVSPGPNRVAEVNSSAILWDCTPGDDLCHATSKNKLVYEINQ